MKERQFEETPIGPMEVVVVGDEYEAEPCTELDLLVRDRILRELPPRTDHLYVPEDKRAVSRSASTGYIESTRFDAYNRAHFRGGRINEFRTLVGTNEVIYAYDHETGKSQMHFSSFGEKGGLRMRTIIRYDKNADAPTIQFDAPPYDGKGSPYTAINTYILGHGHARPLFDEEQNILNAFLKNPEQNAHVPANFLNPSISDLRLISKAIQNDHQKADAEQKAHEREEEREKRRLKKLRKANSELHVGRLGLLKALVTGQLRIR